MTSPLPCPFCGDVGLDFAEGSTFRWRTASCRSCGATTGDERIQTTGSGTPEEWEADCRARLIAAWNHRAAAPTQEPVGYVHHGLFKDFQAGRTTRIFLVTPSEGQPFDDVPLYTHPAPAPLYAALLRQARKAMVDSCAWMDGNAPDVLPAPYSACKKTIAAIDAALKGTAP